MRVGGSSTLPAPEIRTAPRSNGPGNPSVAWNGSAYLVTWANASGVVAQRLRPDGSKLDPTPVVVLTPGFGPADVAALGSDFLVTGRKYGIGPQYIFPIAARVRGGDGAVLDGTSLVLGNSYARTPAVTALGGRWLLVWHANATHDDPYAWTRAAFVSPDGSRTNELPVHGPFSTAGGNGVFEVGLASSGAVALMVQSQELSSGVETDLLGRLIAPDGTAQPMVNLTPWAGNQYLPRVAWDGTSFVLVFQDQKCNPAEWGLEQLDARSDLYGMRITPAASILDPQGFVVSAREESETDPTVAAASGLTITAAAVMRHQAPFAGYRIAYQLLGGGKRWPVPVASASPAAADVPVTVAFSSAGSGDLDGTLASFRWDFGDGAFSTSPSPSHTYTTPGPFVARLTVTDAGGAAASQGLLVKAVAPNLLPIARASVAPDVRGRAPQLYADGSYDPDGFLGNLHWEFSDGDESWGSPAYKTFYEAGTYSATLTVYDARGATGTATVSGIVVGAPNEPPLALAAATPQNGPAPLAVSFSSAGSSDPDGTIAGYLWDFGDGTSSTAPNPSHTYSGPGTYTATLAVTDDRGAVGSASAVVTVTATATSVLRSTAISLTAKLKGSTVTVTGQVTVRNAGGVAVPGAAVTVTWTKPGGVTQTQTSATSSNGVATFSTSGKRGPYTLRVVDVVLAGYASTPRGAC